MLYHHCRCCTVVATFFCCLRGVLLFVCVIGVCASVCVVFVCLCDRYCLFAFLMKKCCRLNGVHCFGMILLLMIDLLCFYCSDWVVLLCVVCFSVWYCRSCSWHCCLLLPMWCVIDVVLLFVFSVLSIVVV